MNVGELVAAIEAQLKTGISDPTIQSRTIEIDDTQEDLVKTIFKVYTDENSNLVIQVG